MKSEHRHELQTNTLASFMNDLPQTLQKHSSKILTVAAIILLVVAYNNYRKNQRETTRLEVQNAMSNAWNSLDELRSGSPSSTPAQIEGKIRSSVQKVLDDADPKTERSLLAHAWLTTGDMYWALATESRTSASAAPTTQPTTLPAAQQEQLRQAADAYQKVVEQYNDQPQQLSAARFSLAAIAETRHDFEAARTQYKALIEAPSTTASNKVMAEQRIAILSSLEKPLLLLPATRPTSDFEGLDASKLKELGTVSPGVPANAPATRPSAPSTQPSK